MNDHQINFFSQGGSMPGKIYKIAAVLMALAIASGCADRETTEIIGTEDPTIQAEPVVGQVAPDFTLGNLDGEQVTLSDYRGRFVVLEWINHGCPYVVKHYATGNMQNLQNNYMEKGVVWLGIGSSAPGQQGYYPIEEWKEITSKYNSTPTHILLDAPGDVGRRYRARTTPEMFVINPEGVLIYMGAIDNDPSRDHASVETANNYVAAALDASLAGNPVDNPATEPYGCSVKY
jgi:peroxiredoxin